MNLDNRKPDILLWKDRNGINHDFSVALVWEDIRPRSDRVHWFDMVWFTHCIPKHAFFLWLVCNKKLKTQDQLRQWDVIGAVDDQFVCPFCELCPDSHSHLFFECTYAKQVWIGACNEAGIQHVAVNWDVIQHVFTAFGRRKSVSIIVSKLMLAATTYFIWQERNSRLFARKKRSADQLIDMIVHTV
uniref:uncharacterized protein LOC122601288 n=1 Tax=Erigeron canadensis TaxID=72917 RepID=UPI001CB891D5|nr:uncharacterized protein LOC122601288 [Erigeron canadensis]